MSSISGAKAHACTREEYINPVAIAQPVSGTNTIEKAISFAALTNNKRYGERLTMPDTRGGRGGTPESRKGP